MPFAYVMRRPDFAAAADTVANLGECVGFGVWGLGFGVWGLRPDPPGFNVKPRPLILGLFLRSLHEHQKPQTINHNPQPPTPKPQPSHLNPRNLGVRVPVDSLANGLEGEGADLGDV